MDWTSSGDVHKRFKLCKQKCTLIFEGPLEEEDEAKKVRMLLLWVGDKGLEIYNTATFTAEADKLKLDPVWEKLEAYTKPQSNQILSRFQLRCLKQGDMPLEEFVTKARLLIDDSGYPAAVKDETLRDTLVFGLRSDKVRKDAIALGNDLTFQKVYNLAKVEESTQAQMKEISKESESSDIHAVRSKHKPPSKSTDHQTFKYKGSDINQHREFTKKPQKFNFNFKYKGCFRCGNNHSKSAECPAKNSRCRYCNTLGHYQKVCMKKRMKKVNEIVNSPYYQGQDIHLSDDSDEDSYDTYHDDTSEDYPVNVTLDSIHSLHSLHQEKDKIYADVKLNDIFKMKFKVDTGADTCVITTDDLQFLPFKFDIVQDDNILTGYGGTRIKSFGTIKMKVTFKDKSIVTNFYIVQAPGSPSMIGCRQSQELGIITSNIYNVDATPISRTMQKYLTRDNVLKRYKDCFDKIGCFPGDKYHIQRIDNPQPVLPTITINLKSNHPDNNKHRFYNEERQNKQVKTYNRKVQMDRDIFNNMDSVYVRNTLKKIWEPGVVLNKPRPIPKITTSPTKDKASSEIIVVKGEKVTYQPKTETFQPKPQTTRSGTVTQVPAKFKD